MLVKIHFKGSVWAIIHPYCVRSDSNAVFCSYTCRFVSVPCLVPGNKFKKHISLSRTFLYLSTLWSSNTVVSCFLAVIVSCSNTVTFQRYIVHDVNKIIRMLCTIARVQWDIILWFNKVVEYISGYYRWMQGCVNSSTKISSSRSRFADRPQKYNCYS